MSTVLPRPQATAKFRKALALSTTSNHFEAEAAEAAARRLMEKFGINPLKVPNGSLYSHDNFTDNKLLAKLRAERLATPKEQARLARNEKARARRAEKQAADRERLVGMFDEIFDAIGETIDG